MLNRTRNFFWIIILLCEAVFLIYLLIPSPDFPDPLPNSRVSKEPADQETPLRRGFYVDQNREEVMNYYTIQLEKLHLFGLSIPAFRLNYPPEESQTIIRDQTRSTFLEEVVHPFRESYFISGFEPREDKDVIVVEGKKWRQKIIVRYVAGNRFARVLSGILAILILDLIIFELTKALKDFGKVLKA
jgi:hypothetical protein